MAGSIIVSSNKTIRPKELRMISVLHTELFASCFSMVTIMSSTTYFELDSEIFRSGRYSGSKKYTSYFMIRCV
ncbi:MAG: hypothetical protein AUJ08_00800 [Thaumarchaeota archaeon 13_1_40CM_3_50_5]|nr:MAG: hypothetical protein AUH71_00775 [Thaumarchaeota archaeon 13_1_40CM_4_48_7]OLC87243.1 MAG: hypothetical protein AUJ08_00800 [Thaumarchaeota archaeon 13_1_40CM_3_50_5]